MIVKIDGDEFELEGIRFGQIPACRRRRRNGLMLTTEDFAACASPAGADGAYRGKDRGSRSEALTWASPAVRAALSCFASSRGFAASRPLGLPSLTREV